MFCCSNAGTELCQEACTAFPRHAIGSGLSACSNGMFSASFHWPAPLVKWFDAWLIYYNRAVQWFRGGLAQTNANGSAAAFCLLSPESFWAYLFIYK